MFIICQILDLASNGQKTHFNIGINQAIPFILIVSLWNYANLKEGSELQIRMTGEHFMDIYVKDLHCKCCGKQLNPSEENVTKVTMCQTCSEVADI